MFVDSFLYVYRPITRTRLVIACHPLQPLKKYIPIIRIHVSRMMATVGYQKRGAHNDNNPRE